MQSMKNAVIQRVTSIAQDHGLVVNQTEEWANVGRLYMMDSDMRVYVCVRYNFQSSYWTWKLESPGTPKTLWIDGDDEYTNHAAWRRFFKILKNRIIIELNKPELKSAMLRDGAGGDVTELVPDDTDPIDYNRG